MYLRFHIKHVFDSQAFPLFVLLLDQFIFGPGHVDTVGRGSSSFLTREVRSSVSVMDQLGLNREQAVRNAGLGHQVVWCDNTTQYNMTHVWQYPLLKMLPHLSSVGLFGAVFVILCHQCKLWKVKFGSKYLKSIVKHLTLRQTKNMISNEDETFGRAVRCWWWRLWWRWWCCWCLLCDTCNPCCCTVNYENIFFFKSRN